MATILLRLPRLNALEAIGLHRTVVSSQGREVVAPTTMTIGEFDGADAGSVRDHIRNEVQAAFKARRLSSEIFVMVGGNWAWGANST